MKKLLLLSLSLVIVILSFSQNEITLNLPDPCNLVGTENNASNDAFSLTVHPNPAKDFVTLSVESQELIDKAVVRIYDSNGKCILTEEFYSANKKCIRYMDISFLNPGSYSILLQNDKAKAITKLVIK